MTDHNIRRYRQTKIVATIGPASGSPEMMRKLFETGVDVFRLNFSHGAHESHAKMLKPPVRWKKNLAVRSA